MGAGLARRGRSAVVVARAAAGGGEGEAGEEDGERKGLHGPKHDAFAADGGAVDAGFVLGGRGFGGQAVAGAGVEVCDRVTEVVETIDAIVKRARFN